MNIPTTGVRDYIVWLVKQHGVAYVRTSLDDLADAVSQLSDAVYFSDEIDDLLVTMKRYGVISGQEMVVLLDALLEEKYNNASI